MEVTKFINKPTEVTSDILCDCCRKSCKTQSGEAYADFEYMELKADWGFFSIKDGESWTAHLCEACVDEKLSFIKFTKRSIF